MIFIEGTFAVHIQSTNITEFEILDYDAKLSICVENRMAEFFCNAFVLSDFLD